MVATAKDAGADRRAPGDACSGRVLRCVAVDAGLRWGFGQRPAARVAEDAGDPGMSPAQDPGRVAAALDAVEAAARPHAVHAEPIHARIRLAIALDAGTRLAPADDALPAGGVSCHGDTDGRVRHERRGVDRGHGVARERGRARCGIGLTQEERVAVCGQRARRTSDRGGPEGGRPADCGGKHRSARTRGRGVDRHGVDSFSRGEDIRRHR